MTDPEKTKSELRNPHDLLFKETLSNRANARSFLEKYLPKEILEIADLESLEIEKDSFITKELEEYFSDLLYKMSIQGREAYVCVLFEHKSYHEKWIGLQLLEYMLQYWKLKKKQKQKLPVIIPLVLYHGREKWSTGLQFSDIMEVGDSKLRQYVPDFKYILYDLVRCDDAELVGIANLKVMLKLLKYIKSPDLCQRLGEILRLLAQEDLQYLSTVIVYVLRTTEIPKETFSQLVEENISKEGGQIVMTTAEKLMQEGKKDVAIEMLKDGMDIKQIVKFTKLPEEEVLKLKKELEEKKK